MSDEIRERITDTEEVARQVIGSNWDNVLRTTPNAIKEFEEEFPHICELVSRKVQEQGVEDLGNVFRPGVPDFLAFDDSGDYSFIEVKGKGDGLRHSQLKWFRDFQELNAEIWFADSNEGVTEKMGSERLNAYSLKKPETANTGEAEIKDGEEGFLDVQLPETLAAVMQLEKGDRVSWSIRDRSVLELDTD
ncbi:MAG: VRR-NUC domain-containing protein [Candidatus Nanosalina sp.]